MLAAQTYRTRRPRTAGLGAPPTDKTQFGRAIWYAVQNYFTAAAPRTTDTVYPTSNSLVVELVPYGSDQADTAQLEGLQAYSTDPNNPNTPDKGPHGGMLLTLPLLDPNITQQDPALNVWQLILMADKQLPDGMPTGKFDVATLAATKAWQSAHGLPPDAVIGPLTWQKASVWPSAAGGATTSDNSWMWWGAAALAAVGIGIAAAKMK